MLPIDIIRQQAGLPAMQYPIYRGGEVRHARLMFLEFITLLLVLPIDQVNLIVGGPAGLALIVQIYDALHGGPSQDGKNSKHLN